MDQGPSLRLSPLGWVLIALLLGGLALAQFGPRALQAPGFLVAALAGLALLLATLPGRAGRVGPGSEARAERDPKPAAEQPSRLPDAAREPGATESWED